MSRLVWDQCPGCSWRGEVDWECRMCPRCEMELEGWSARRGKKAPMARKDLNYKQLLVKRGVECEDC